VECVGAWFGWLAPYTDAYLPSRSSLRLQVNILRRVPHSVLVLFSSDADAVKRIKREARAAGVVPARIMFLPRVAKVSMWARGRRVSMRV